MRGHTWPALIAAAAGTILLVSGLVAVTREGDDGLLVADRRDEPTHATTASEQPDPEPTARDTTPTGEPSTATTSEPAPTEPPAITSGAAPGDAGATLDPTPQPTASTPATPTPTPTPTPTSSAANGFVPVPAGTHAYDTDGTTSRNGNEERLPAVTTLEASQASGGRQQLRRDLRRDSGEGSVTTLHMTMGDDGAFLHQVDIDTAVMVLGTTYNDERTFTGDGPVLLTRPGPRPGDQQQFTLTGGDTVLDGTVTVVGTETLQVGGQAVETLVVEQVFDISGDVEGRSTTTAWMRPSDLLTVREQVHSRFTGSGMTIESDHTSVLQALP